jgi:hypothetical protein
MKSLVRAATSFPKARASKPSCATSRRLAHRHRRRRVWRHRGAADVEDILEEIVRDIRDSAIDEAPIEVEEDALRVSGRVSLEGCPGDWP